MANKAQAAIGAQQGAQATTDQDQPQPSGRKLEIAVQWAAIISVFAIVLATFFQIRADADLTKKETTASLVSLSFSPTIFNAKATLTRELSQNASSYAEIILRRELANGELQSDERPRNEEIALPTLSQPVRDAFVVLIEFYTQVVRCQTSGACHDELTANFFKKDICLFNTHYKDIAQAVLEEQYDSTINLEIDEYCNGYGADPRA